MNGRACGLVIKRDRDQGRRGPVAAVDGEHDRRQGRQQVDGLVLAPPGADVEDGGVQQDGRGRATDRPARPGAQGIQRRERPGPMSASDAGSFINARIAGSEASVTVWKAGWMAASAPQMRTMTGPNVMSRS